MNGAVRWADGSAPRPIATSGVVALLTALLVALAPVPPAAAAPTWVTPPVDVSSPATDASSAEVGVDAAGTSVAVWTSSVEGHGVIQTASRPPGGEWSSPLDLSPPGQDAASPSLDVASDGAAIAAWRLGPGGSSVVRVALRSPTGAWGEPETVSTGTGSALTPDAEISASGDAVVVWVGFIVTDVVSAATRPRGGAWSAPVGLSDGTQHAFLPQVALDEHGATTVVWTRYNGSQYVVQATERPAGGGWGRALDVSGPDHSAYDARVVTDSSGVATAVWTWQVGTHLVIEAASRLPAASWSVPVRLTAGTMDPLENFYDPWVAVDTEGTTTAVWTHHGGGRDVVQAATRPRLGTWTAAVDVSDRVADTGVARISGAGTGRFLVVWQQPSEGRNTVRASALLAPGAWQAPVLLSDGPGAAGNARVAVDGNGDAVAVWVRAGGRDVVQARGFDVTAPTLSGFSAPTSGLTHQPLSYAVAPPFDVWSAVASPVWSFGDGSSASGTTVVHTYALAGSYPVTVTATDAVGNATSLTGTTTVSDPPMPPPGPPTITKLRLSHHRIQAAARSRAHRQTRLVVGLSDAALIAVTVRSRHRHSASLPGRPHRITVRLTRALPVGTSRLRIRGRLAHVRLRPDRYVITVVASNASGHSPARRVTLVVGRP